jgi:hypothetical protein
MLLTVLIIQIGLLITLITGLLYVKKGLFQTQQRLDEYIRLIDIKMASPVESNILEESDVAILIDWNDESEYWHEVEQQHSRR